MRFEGVPPWKGMLLAGVANTFGLLLIQIVQYMVFALTGTVFWTDGWLYVQPALRRRADHVHLALLPLALLSANREDLSRPDDDLLDLHHDLALEHGLLLAALEWARGSCLSTGPSRPTGLASVTRSASRWIISASC